MDGPPTPSDAAPTELRPFGRSLVLRRLPLCPEIQLWLLGDEFDLEAECRALHELESPPYWAFCWGSGQALARFLLDHREEVRSRRVVDLGAGSGVVAVAAAMAGARSVVAVDTDPAALCAIRLNAAVNGVPVGVAHELPGDWDVLLASDFVYETENRDRLVELAQGNGSVIVGDPERPSSPRFPTEPLARVSARTVPDVDSPMRTAAIFRL